MNFDFFQKDDTNIDEIKNKVLRTFPLLGVTLSNIKTKPTNKILTAGTDGNTIYYSPKFFNTLTFDEKVFAYSHEVMHIAFDHILRSKGKDPEVWNIATDSVINQILKAEKLPIPKEAVNYKEAINKSAEEMYEKLFREKQNQQQGQDGQSASDKNKQQPQQNQQSQDNQQSQNNQQSQDNQQSQNGNGQQNNGQQSNQRNPEQEKDYQEQLNRQNQLKNQVGHDNHGLWENAVKKAEKEENKEQKNNQRDNPQDDNGKQNENNSMNKFEQEFQQLNKRKKQEMADKIRKQLKREHFDSIKTAGKGMNGEAFETSFHPTEIDETKAVVSWKKLLSRELEKDEEVWSYRRANEENDFCARIGEVELNERPGTEVLLDTSVSINDELLRGFLRQLKPLLRESKLYVGCFDTRFYGFKEIKNKTDINNYSFTGRGGTSFDTAIRSFSNNKKINKIIFTDGYDEVSRPIPENLKNAKIYWLVFDRKDFKPGVGKVLYVDAKKIEQHMNLEMER